MQPRIKNIRQHIIFRNIIGVLLSCTFLLSITPKLTLHNISANHKDDPSKKVHDRLQYNEVGFNCDCNSIVATSPFTEPASCMEILKLAHFSFYTGSPLASISLNDHFYFTLRGPPAVI